MGGERPHDCLRESRFPPKSPTCEAIVGDLVNADAVALRQLLPLLLMLVQGAAHEPDRCLLGIYPSMCQKQPITAFRWARTFAHFTCSTRQWERNERQRQRCSCSA